MAFKDFHLHLSGSTDVVTLWELVCESGHKLPVRTFREFSNSLLMDDTNVNSLESYLAVLHAIDGVQSFPKAIERSVYDAFVNHALSGGVNLQLRFNPVKRSQNGLIDLDTIIVSARAGMEKAKMWFGIDGGLILCLGRDCTKEQNLAITRKAIRYFNKGVIGIDVAGDYFKFTEGDLLAKVREEYENLGITESIKLAQAAGMLVTFHVGESKTPCVMQDMWYVIEEIKPNRIGHGIQIVNYPNLMALAKDRNIEFEICMSSNIRTKAVSSYNKFAEIFTTMRTMGLGYHVCTDSTVLLGTSIARENEIHDNLV